MYAGAPLMCLVPLAGRKSCQFPGTGVIASRDPKCECCELNLCPLEEQSVLFISPAPGGSYLYV